MTFVLIAVSSSYLMRRLFPDRFRGYKLSFPSMARLRWREGRDYHSFTLAAARKLLQHTNVLREASHTSVRTGPSEERNNNNSRKKKKPR